MKKTVKKSALSKETVLKVEEMESVQGGFGEGEEMPPPRGSGGGTGGGGGGGRVQVLS